MLALMTFGLDSSSYTLSNVPKETKCFIMKLMNWRVRIEAREKGELYNAYTGKMGNWAKLVIVGGSIMLAIWHSDFAFGLELLLYKGRIFVSETAVHVVRAAGWNACHQASLRDACYLMTGCYNFGDSCHCTRLQVF